MSKMKLNGSNSRFSMLIYKIPSFQGLDFQQMEFKDFHAPYEPCLMDVRLGPVQLNAELTVFCLF